MGQPGLIPGGTKQHWTPGFFHNSRHHPLANKDQLQTMPRRVKIGKEMEVAVACVWQVDKTFRKRTMFFVQLSTCCLAAYEIYLAINLYQYVASCLWTYLVLSIAAVLCPCFCVFAAGHFWTSNDFSVPISTLQQAGIAMEHHFFFHR